MIAHIFLQNMTLMTLLILAVCRMHVMYIIFLMGLAFHSLCGSVVKQLSAKSEGLRIFFSLACDKTKKNMFLFIFTKLKTYHLSYFIYKSINTSESKQLFETSSLINNRH